jgi:sensor histidine kinase regulating citrate/malate metabolism
MFDADTVLPSIILLLCAILALALEMIVFWLSRKLIQNYENTIVNVAQRSQQDGDSQLAQAVTRINEELREMRHEIRNHLSLINTLLAQGEIEQAKAIVASLADEESSLLTPISTISSGNRVADAILSQKIAQAKVLGIPMKVEAYLTENLPIASIDLCSLLSNLINNALEASAKINEPSISVVIKPLKNYISIKVTNAIDRSVLTFNPELATTKRNPESHGIGLEIVKKVAAKYDGITHFEAQDRQFNSEVLLQLNAEGTLTRSLDSRSLAPLEPRARID